MSSGQSNTFIQENTLFEEINGISLYLLSFKRLILIVLSEFSNSSESSRKHRKLSPWIDSSPNMEKERHHSRTLLYIIRRKERPVKSLSILGLNLGLVILRNNG